MLWVLHLRSTVLPLVTFFFYVVFDVLRAPPTQYRFTAVLGRQPRGSISYSTYLTGWVTHDPSTGVRATTSLRGERAHLTMLILSPPNGFLSRSLFHNPPHSCGERMFFDGFHDFSRQSSPLSVLCSIMETCSFTSSPIGGWGRRKAGDWGRKPGRGRGIAAGLPPFPWVVSPSIR